jgi:hypothetical protein
MKPGITRENSNGIGFYAAIGACAASIGYGIPQILQVVGLLPAPLGRWLTLPVAASACR